MIVNEVKVIVLNGKCEWEDKSKPSFIIPLLFLLNILCVPIIIFIRVQK